MNALKERIFGHPVTSIIGVLIGISGICGVLSQQGITLGHAGNGTVVALISALAAMLLGLLSKQK
jgi:hypothetical protein